MSALVIPHEAGGEAWDTLTLGGVRFGGLAVVSGDAFKKKIDKRRAAGADGARIVDKGFDLVELNGQIVHQNQIVESATGLNWTRSEPAKGPLMFQLDHGPVALRKFRARENTASK